jgi:hypothetical protein
MEVTERLAPASFFWFFFTYVVGFISPWFGLFLYYAFGKTQMANLSAKAIFFVSIITIIVLAVKTLQFLTFFKKERLLFSATLTTLCLISFIVAMFIYMG